MSSKPWNLTVRGESHLKWKQFPKGVQFELVQQLNIWSPPPKKKKPLKFLVSALKVTDFK